MAYDANHIADLDETKPLATESPAVLDDVFREIKRCLKNDWETLIPTSDTFVEVVVGSDYTITLPASNPRLVLVKAGTETSGYCIRIWVPGEGHVTVWVPGGSSVTDTIKTINSSFSTDEPSVVTFFNVGKTAIYLEEGGNIKIATRKTISNSGIALIKNGSYWYVVE
jgi:hypothetical protein